MDDTIAVKDLCFRYIKNDILRNISFSIPKGSICGLLGPNGSGKTTLLKCINGLRTPYKGNVFINGSSVYKMSRENVSRLISMVPQQSNIVFPYTVLDMVLLGKSASLGWTKMPSSEDQEKASELLEHLELSHLKNRCVNELSGGEKQMVMIARALFQNTGIILLDEPTAHLDFKNAYMVLDKVKNISEENNLTTLITLHDPNLAGYYCSKLIMLKDGQLIFNGSSDDGFKAKKLSRLYSMDICIENTSSGVKMALPAFSTKTTSVHCAAHNMQ